jgi:O-antigen/teichoic acid export membrane protein
MSSSSQSPAGASLRRNVAWALAGNLGYSACQWGVLVCIAKLGTAADVGRFALGLALTAPVITLISLNLRLLQSTDARSDYPFSVYLSVRLVGTVLGLAAIAVMALALGYRGDLLYLILVVAFAKAFEAVSYVVFGLLQKAENLRRVAISMLLKGVISVLAVGVVLRLTGDLVLATLAMALCWGSLLATYDLPAAVRIESLRPTLKPRTLARLAWVALPLGCVAGISSLAFNVPRYFIEDALGATALGHFTALSYLFVAATQPMLALGMAVNPRLGRHFVADLGAYRRLTGQMMLIAGGMGLVGIVACALFGRSVLALAYAPEYAAQEVVFVWLAAATGVGFLGQALSYAVTAARRLPEQLPIALLSLAVCTVGSYLLVPAYGLLGAAWAVLATEATKLACLGAVYVGAVAGASPVVRPLKGGRRSLQAKGDAAEGDAPPRSARASLIPRPPGRKPLIIEIAGCSGSGKSTLMKEILRQCAERGLPVATAEEVALPRLPHAIRRHPTLQNLALDLRGVTETITLRRDREFLAFAMAMIRRDTDRAFTALSACRGVLRKLAIHSLLAREANGWHAVLVDEGTIHSAHYVLAHVNHPPRREDVELFCRLVPMPDLVVHVAGRLETVLARTFARSDPPLRWRTKAELERFIRHAHAMFDLLMGQDALSPKTLRVECDDDGLGAYRTFAKEIVDRIVDGSASAPGIARAV